MESCFLLTLPFVVHFLAWVNAVLAKGLLTEAGAVPAGPQPARAVADSTVDGLERLAAMRDSGALTDQEFASAKKSLLGAGS